MILFKYILKSLSTPFIFSVVTLIFIFLLQFLMKFADRLVGKGLGAWVVIQLITYNLAWMVVLVVPMAVLVATLMAFGGMSQNNEFTVMKSSGVSLYKMMIPPFLASMFIGYLLILFNNDVLPDANHQAKNLMNDISRKKPTLSLVPGIFSQEVSNYSILARNIDENTNELTNITMYDYSNPTAVTTVTAKKGKLYFSSNHAKLIMDLTEGEIHEHNIIESNIYRKLIFKEHRITMPADQFSLQQTGPGGQRGDRELSSSDMLFIVDSLNKIRDYYLDILRNESKRVLLVDSNFYITKFSGEVFRSHDLILTRIKERVNAARNIIYSSSMNIQRADEEINRFMVEVHKKYSIPAACLIFVLIGCPLGTMTRKGGFGIAASISLLFFLIYWAFLIGGEKLADRTIISPFWGMWGANIFIGFLGVLLTIKTAKENVTINFSSLKRFIPKILRNHFDSGENENT